MSYPRFSDEMYVKNPSFVLGFHGTTKSVASRVITSPSEPLKCSKNKNDWLGHGIYFWENDPQMFVSYLGDEDSR